VWAAHGRAVRGFEQEETTATKCGLVACNMALELKE
jgi:hypothetical protein